MSQTVNMTVQSNTQRIGLGANTLNGQQNVPMHGGATFSNRDYERLKNIPSLNGIPIIGDHDSHYYLIDTTYVYEQAIASSEWDITHNLEKYPSVTVVDSGGNQVLGAVTYISANRLIVSFSAAFGGKAYLN